MVVKDVKVIAIENGTVIDHIPTESLFKVVAVMGFKKTKEEILIGTNLKSKKLGKKGILKISNTYLSKKDLDRISILAQGSKVNTIKNFKVVEKREVKLPKEINEVVKCFNPNCISNHESLKTNFKIVQERPLKLKCKYCEKLTQEDQILFF